MFLKIKNLKLVTTLLASIFLFSFLTIALPVKSAEFYPKNEKEQNFEIKATRDNVYAAGSEIRVTESVAKDLILAGSEISIKGNVGRSIIAAGSKIEINSSRVGGATRLAAGEIILTGNFAEEVIVAASSVVIENATINGDLIVSADKLTLKNSRISGNANLTYSTLEGDDLKGQVLGELKKNKVEPQPFYSGENLYSFLITQLSVIIFLLIVSSILSKRNTLALSDIDFSSRYWKDLGIGLGFAILTLPVVVILSFLQLYPLALLLGAIIYLLYFLSSFFLPIYAANLVKNTAKLETKISTLVIITYLVIAILSFIPVVNIISFIFLFFVQAANFGYLSRKLNHTFFASLPPPSKLEMKEETKKKSETKKESKEDEKEDKSDKKADSKMEQE